MESDFSAIIQSVIILAILNLIPIVIFAIWLDHFESDLKDQLIKDPGFEKEPEVEKVRFLSFVILLYQLILFLGADDVRAGLPLLCDLILVLAAGGQITLQLRAEKAIFGSGPESEGPLPIVLRAIRAWFIAAAICGFLAIFGAIVGRMIAAQAQLTGGQLASVLILSSTIGMGLGLFLNFALVPYHILKILPTIPLQEHRIVKTIQSIFESHQLETPKLWRIELRKLRVLDLALSGSRNGTGPFAYSLFISQLTLNVLSEAEIKSLILIEVSHLKLNHLRKRVNLAAGLICNSLILAILAEMTVSLFFPGSTVGEMFGTLIGFFSFVLSIRWIALQKQTQEFEGDTYALKHLGLNFDDFSNALRKLDFHWIKENHPEHAEHLPLVGLPDTERRLFLLSTYLAQQNQPKTPEHEDLAA